MKTTMKIIVLALAASSVLLLAGCDQVLESMFQMEQNTIEITANVLIPAYQPLGWWDQKVWFKLFHEGELVTGTAQSSYMIGNSNGSWAIASVKYEGVPDGNNWIEVWFDTDGNGVFDLGELGSTTFFDPQTGYSVNNVTMPRQNPNDPSGRYANLRVDLYW